MLGEYATAAVDFKCWWMIILSELQEMNWGQLPELIKLTCFVLTGNKTNFRDFQRMLFACFNGMCVSVFCTLGVCVRACVE